MLYTHIHNVRAVYLVAAYTPAPPGLSYTTQCGLWGGCVGVSLGVCGYLYIVYETVRQGTAPTLVPNTAGGFSPVHVCNGLPSHAIA